MPQTPKNNKKKAEPELDLDDEKVLGAGLADQTLKPTSVSDWRRPVDSVLEADREGFIVELPSGNVIRMTRTMDMATLLKTGKIPNPLAGIVQSMIDNHTPIFPKTIKEGDAIMQLLDLMNEMAVRCIMEPPFDMPEARQKNETAEQYQDRLSTWEPAEGKISVWDLTPEDRQYIFAISQGAAADLASFREESDAAMEAFQASLRVPKPSKRTGGAKSKK